MKEVRLILGSIFTEKKLTYTVDSVILGIAKISAQERMPDDQKLISINPTSHTTGIEVTHGMKTVL